MMSKTRQGRLFYVIGGNKEASRLSGVQLHLNVILAYVICGALGAFAGLMSAARSGSGNPEAGINFLLDGLIAITLGSTFLTEEREYKALGSVVGALYITMMINGMQMMGCGNHQQCIMRGVLLLVGLTLSFAAAHRDRIAPKLVERRNGNGDNFRALRTQRRNDMKQMR